MQIVKIRKLKTNYELRYDFNQRLTEYIKRLPKEHRNTRVDSVLTPDGTQKEEWVRIISSAKIGEIINFLVDNGNEIKFENLSEEEINHLRKEYLNRIKKINEILKSKAEGIDISGSDFSFMKSQPYDYQKQAIVFFEKAHGKAILGDQPGVGKTLSALGYAAKNKLRTLVVCPASLKLNWKNEIHKFSNEKAFIFKYQPRKSRKEELYKKEESLFHIINYESLETYIKFEYKHKCKARILNGKGGLKDCDWEIVDLEKSYTTCPNCSSKNKITSRAKGMVFFKDKLGEYLDPSEYDLVVLDECHYIKNSQAFRTKLIKKAFLSVPKKLLLSGTAIKNRPFEFFSILNFLEPEEWKSSHDFGVRYAAGYQSNFGWDFSGASNLEELFERISPYFLRRLKKDILQALPPKTYTNIPLDLKDTEFREYKKIERGASKELAEEEKKPGAHLTKIHELRQFTSAIKAEKAKEFIQDIIDGDEKVVVFSNYVEVLQNLYKIFPEISVIHTGRENISDRQKAVDEFQSNKKIKVFFGSIASAGVGITLTAANKLIFIDSAWSPSDNEQAEDRIHRASTKHDNIQIIKLICIDTLDEDIEQLLEEKSKVVSRVLDGKSFDKKVDTVKENIFKDLLDRIKNKKD